MGNRRITYLNRIESAYAETEAELVVSLVFYQETKSATLNPRIGATICTQSDPLCSTNQKSAER